MDPIQLLRDTLLGKPHAEWRAFAAACDVNYFTLRKIVSGETADPGYLTVDKIRAYFERTKPASARRSASNRMNV